MNENDENIDPMRDAALDVEHLRLEISENGEVFYRIDDVTLMMFRSPTCNIASRVTKIELWVVVYLFGVSCFIRKTEVNFSWSVL